MLLLIRVVMRTAHLVAASAWVGGSIFYLVALLPGLRDGEPAPRVAAAVARSFRAMVNVCMGTLLLTGMFLTFDRLSSTTLGTAYVAVLVAKIVVALSASALAVYQAQEGANRARGKRTATGAFRAAPRWILALGLAAFALGAILTTLYETGLIS
jgi:putative copper export protein